MFVPLKTDIFKSKLSKVKVLASETFKRCLSHEEPSWMGLLLHKEAPERSLPLPSYACLHALSCPTLCDPMDCSPPGSSVHRIFQTRILKWVSISYSKGSSRCRNLTHLSCCCRLICYHWATWEAHMRPQQEGTICRSESRNSLDPESSGDLILAFQPPGL